MSMARYRNENVANSAGDWMDANREPWTEQQIEERMEEIKLLAEARARREATPDELRDADVFGAMIDCHVDDLIIDEAERYGDRWEEAYRDALRWAR